MIDRPFRSFSRRALLKGAASLPLLGALPAMAADPAKTKLVILGSMGGPSVGRARYMTSNVILHGGKAHVVDCGYGVTEQLIHAGVKLQDIADIFITHNHPDHNIELGTLLYFAWFAGLDDTPKIYGPPPIAQIAADYVRAEKPDVDVWLGDLGRKPMGPLTVKEISSAGPVMRNADMTVTSAIVHHPPVVPALAFRFDFADRSIVFSGDTSPMESVARLARGADVLVHEAMYLPAMKREVAARHTGSAIAGDRDKLWAHLMRSHSPAEEVGRIAQEAGVKTLVLSHLVPITGVTDAQWQAAAHRHFKGRVIVARDLMVI